MVQDARVLGTCEWILDKELYADWKSQQHDAPPILWMSGKPGTGKSVLAGSVIDDLKRSGLDYSYYFFKHGDSSKSRLSSCLRSLALQMASTDPGVRDLLVNLQTDRFRIDHENERSLWKALFVSGAFEAATTTHFWVIDALDECADSAPFLDSMLSKLDITRTWLRVFIISRETAELCRLFSGLGPRRHKQGHISAEETLPDIKRIVEAKGETLFTDGEESRAVLERSIIESPKARSCGPVWYSMSCPLPAVKRRLDMSSKKSLEGWSLYTTALSRRWPLQRGEKHSPKRFWPGQLVLPGP